MQPLALSNTQLERMPHKPLMFNRKKGQHMTRYLDRDDDDDADLFEVIDGKKVLRDGARWKVPLRMHDALQRDVARHNSPQAARLHDGRGGPVGRKAGFLVNDAVADEDCRQAYADYDNWLRNEYRKPPTIDAGGEFIGQRVGDLCTINGYPGRLVSDDETGELVCMADYPSGSHDTRTLDEVARDHKLRMAEEYAAADLALSNAWRRP